MIWKEQFTNGGLTVSGLAAINCRLALVNSAGVVQSLMVNSVRGPACGGVSMGDELP